MLIIGSGPAGLTAGLYASRAGRKATILEGSAASRLSIGYQVENYRESFPSAASSFWRDSRSMPDILVRR